jgi:hypothetical protein
MGLAQDSLDTSRARTIKQLRFEDPESSAGMETREQGEFACDECEAVFKSQGDLEDHKRTAHRLIDMQEATFASSSPD